jgi:VWFA-related protein
MLAGLGISNAADAPSVTYHSTVSEVRLTFVATNGRNQAVGDLQRGDFAVVDNDVVIRNFRSFNHSSETTLNTVVLIDSSESVMRQFRKEIVEVLNLTTGAQWMPQDKLSIVSIAGAKEEIICADDCRSASAAQKVAALANGGLTPLFDAVTDTAQSFIDQKDASSRPVIILFSDGDDTNSNASFRDAMTAILRSEAQVYAVDLNNPKNPSQGTAVLQQMAEASGGRYFTMRDGPAKILSSIMGDLHSAEVVTYVPPLSNQSFHSVTILPTHNLNLQFRCRRGYYNRANLDK